MWGAIICCVIVIIIITLAFVCLLLKTQSDKMNKLEKEVRNSISEEFHRDFMLQFIQDYDLHRAYD